MSIMDDLHLTLSRRFAEGVVGPDAYHAHCINYAAYLATQGELSEASRVLGKVPESFFDALAEGAANTRNAEVVAGFVDAVNNLAQLLLDAGMVTPDQLDTMMTSYVSSSKGLPS